MILTVFRSRLHGEDRQAYDEQVRITAALAEQTPGFRGHKMFVAEDGERVTLVEFEDMAAQRAWSLSAEHRAAAKAGRRAFYDFYKIQICNVQRESTFVRPGSGITDTELPGPNNPARAQNTPAPTPAPPPAVRALPTAKADAARCPFLAAS